MLEKEANKSTNDEQTSAKNKSHLFTLQLGTSQGKIKNVWYADSGATAYMSFQREFKSFVPFTKDACLVKEIDGKTHGLGDVEVQVMNPKQSCVYIIRLSLCSRS